MGNIKIAGVSNTMLPCAMDSEADDMVAESTISMDHVAAVARRYGPEAGLQALLLATGAGLNLERKPL